MHSVSTTRLAVILFMSLGSAPLASAADSGSPTRFPPSTVGLTENQALAELKELGGILVHFDDRKPGRPVIAADFTNHPRFQETWLRHLAAFPHLSSLGLAGTSLTDSGMRHLGNLRELDTLTLAETKVTDEGLAELLRLKKLRRLDVRGTAVTAAGATALRRFLPQLEVAATGRPGGSPRPATAEPLPPSQVQGGSATISAAKIKELRQQAMALSLPAEGAQPEPEGWSKSRFAPNQLVELFQPLRLRQGFVLRAYVFREQGNGNGVVWAMPAEAEFPVPEDCPALEHHLLQAPKPSEALDDVMEAIEGDGSARSYLAASLLRRELREFGAMWHGCHWSAHVVLDEDPWNAGPPREEDSPLDRPTSERREWKWLEPQPVQWSPRADVEKDRVTVTFHTYSGLGKESIYRHTDTYRAGKYRPKIEQQRIAVGPAEFAF